MAEKSKEQLKVEFIFDDGNYWIDYESRNEAVLYTF